MLRSAACVAAIALVTAGGASAEVVARGVQDGFLALDAKGAPSVAWVRNSTLFVAERPATDRWTPNGGGIGSAGLERGGVRDRRCRAGRCSSRAATTARSCSCAPRSVGWQTIRVAKVGALFRLGWPGPRARPATGLADDRLHALERPDAEEPAARLARRREGSHHDAPDHAGGLPEEPRAAARRARALRRRRARGRVVWLPRRARARSSGSPRRRRGSGSGSTQGSATTRSARSSPVSARTGSCTRPGPSRCSRSTSRRRP